MNLRISEGLAQARTNHRQVCKFLGFLIDVNGDGQFSISLVFETFEKDVSQAIEERKQANIPYTETEVRTFLFQASQTLTYMHSKVFPRQNISHWDVKPENMFFANDVYKVGNFTSLWEKESLGEQFTEDGVSTVVLMSPQVKNCVKDHGEKYQPFKNDVYSLGVTALNLAAIIPPLYLKNVERLDEAVQQEVGRLRYSEKLKALLREMISASEEGRSLMQEVVQRFMPPIPPSPQVEKRISFFESLRIAESVSNCVLASFSPEDILLDPEPLYRADDIGVKVFKGAAFHLRVILLKKQWKKE